MSLSRGFKLCWTLYLSSQLNNLDTVDTAPLSALGEFFFQMNLYQHDSVYREALREDIYCMKILHVNNIDEQFTQILHELIYIKANHKRHEMETFF